MKWRGLTAKPAMAAFLFAAALFISETSASAERLRSRRRREPRPFFDSDDDAEKGKTIKIEHRLFYQDGIPPPGPCIIF